jgi:hypothetical protein
VVLLCAAVLHFGVEILSRRRDCNVEQVWETSVCILGPCPCLWTHTVNSCQPQHVIEDDKVFPGLLRPHHTFKLSSLISWIFLEDAVQAGATDAARAGHRQYHLKPSSSLLAGTAHRSLNRLETCIQRLC